MCQFIFYIQDDKDDSKYNVSMHIIFIKLIHVYTYPQACN